MLIEYNVSAGFKPAPSELIDEPKIVRVLNFSQDAVKTFKDEMDKAYCTGQEYLVIDINSYGGSVYGLRAMLDIVEFYKKEVPVITYCGGVAMSAAAVLLSAGTPGFRYCSPSSTVMVHGVSTSMMGKAKDIENDTEEMTRLGEQLFGTLDTNSKKKAGYWKKKLKKNHNSDLYLDAQAAKKCGLVDRIGTPVFKVKARLKWSLK